MNKPTLTRYELASFVYYTKRQSHPGKGQSRFPDRLREKAQEILNRPKHDDHYNPALHDESDLDCPTIASGQYKVKPANLITMDRIVYTIDGTQYGIWSVEDVLIEIAGLPEYRLSREPDTNEEEDDIDDSTVRALNRSFQRAAAQRIAEDPESWTD
jgi:hypothetical protein